MSNWYDALRDRQVKSERHDSVLNEEEQLLVDIADSEGQLNIEALTLKMTGAEIRTTLNQIENELKRINELAEVLVDAKKQIKTSLLRNLS